MAFVSRHDLSTKNRDGSTKNNAPVWNIPLGGTGNFRPWIFQQGFFGHWLKMLPVAGLGDGQKAVLG